jgi:hypothetical protein
MKKQTAVVNHPSWRGKLRNDFTLNDLGGC